MKFNSKPKLFGVKSSLFERGLSQKNREWRSNKIPFSRVKWVNYYSISRKYHLQQLRQGHVFIKKRKYKTNIPSGSLTDETWNQ